jgi:hypothetical protein
MSEVLKAFGKDPLYIISRKENFATNKAKVR